MTRTTKPISIAWDDDTARALSLHPDLAPDIGTTFLSLARAKAQDKDAKATTDAAKAFLIPTLTAIGITTLVSPTIGTALLKTGTNVSYSANKIEEFLLAKGVPPAVVAGAIAAGKNVTTYQSIQFTLPKPPKRG